MIQSYILYGIILLYKPVTVTGNAIRNTPSRDMCYTHNHRARVHYSTPRLACM